jgi:hypothetical protein
MLYSARLQVTRVRFGGCYFEQALTDDRLGSTKNVPGATVWAAVRCSSRGES